MATLQGSAEGRGLQAMTTEEKLAQLERILNGRTLHGSENLKAFLRFVVEKTVENGDGGLKEYVIATEVFGRNTDYNSRIDSVVRVQASRLRVKLHDYYATEGKSDQVVIDLPKGHYTPTFSYNSFADCRTGTENPRSVQHGPPACRQAFEVECLDDSLAGFDRSAGSSVGCFALARQLRKSSVYARPSTLKLRPPSSGRHLSHCGVIC